MAKQMMSPDDVRIFDDKGQLLDGVEKLVDKLDPENGDRLREVIRAAKAVSAQEELCAKITADLREMAETRNQIASQLAQSRPSFLEVWQQSRS